MVEQKILKEISDLFGVNGWKPQPIRAASLYLLINGDTQVTDKEACGPIKLGQTYMLSSYHLLGELLSVASCFEAESEKDPDGILRMAKNISRVPKIRTPLEAEPLQAYAVQFWEDRVIVTEVLPCSCGQISTRQVPVSYDDFLSSLRTNYRYSD